ncbi:MAG: MFS transporter [Cyanobacteriota bacterium]|nr:MFS transporter [Cyanobacteriota bacterium]
MSRPTLSASPPTSPSTSPSWGAIVAEQPALIPLLSIVMLVMMGIGLVSPVLSLYGATFEVGVTLAGMIITVFGIARLLINIPAGSLSQRWGRRPLLVGGLVTLAISSFGAAGTDHFLLLLLWRIGQGMGSGLYITSAMASVADLSSPPTRGRMMALYQGAVSIGTTLGPAFGGWIATHFGLRAPFWVFGLLALLAIVVALTSLPETLSPDKRTAPPSQRVGSDSLGSDSLNWGSDLRLVFCSPGFLMITLISFGTFFTRTAAKLNLLPLAIYYRFGLGAGTVGLILMAATVINFFTLPFVGSAIDRFGNKLVVLWSSGLCAVSLLLLAWANTLLPFCVSMGLFSIATGICIPATGAYTAEVTPHDRYGPAMGIFRSISDAGFILGPLLVGLIVDISPWGLAGGLVFNGFLALGLTAAFWYSGPELVKKTS